MTPQVRLSPATDARLDEIYAYTRETWGEDQAERYVLGIFAVFAAIAKREVVWRRIPAELGVDGWYARYERHFIYWKVLADGDLGIVTILHQRMHQMDRFREDAGEP